MVVVVVTMVVVVLEGILRLLKWFSHVFCV